MVKLLAGMGDVVKSNAGGIALTKKGRREGAII